MLRLATAALAVAGLALGGTTRATAQDEAAQRQTEVAEKLSKIPDRLTTFDYIEQISLVRSVDNRVSADRAPER